MCSSCSGYGFVAGGRGFKESLWKMRRCACKKDEGGGVLFLESRCRWVKEVGDKNGGLGNKSRAAKNGVGL